ERFAAVVANLPQRPSPVRPRSDRALSLHDCLARGLSLPASSDLFRICRCGARSLRPVGRRLDDTGAAFALPAMGHLRPRSRARCVAGKIALVYAVALREMAGHEFDAVRPITAITTNKRHALAKDKVNESRPGQ